MQDVTGQVHHLGRRAVVERQLGQPPAIAERLAERGRPTRSAADRPGLGDVADLDVIVLSAREAKGLEFDSVLVVDPDGIVIESPRGLRDLYVALTRCTQRLGVIGELPDVLRDSGAWDVRR